MKAALALGVFGVLSAVCVWFASRWATGEDLAAARRHREEDLLWALGNVFHSGREKAVQELIASPDLWRDELRRDTTHWHPKRAAAAMRVLYMRGKRLSDLRATLASIARECGPSWRRFTWAATAFVEDLCDGKPWDEVEKRLREHGLRPLKAPRQGVEIETHYFEAGIDTLALPQGCTLVLRFEVHKTDRGQTTWGDPAVGLLAGPQLLENWERACQEDESVAFLADVLRQEELAEYWSRGMRLTGVEIVGSDYCIGLPREPKLEYPAAFEVTAVFLAGDERAGANYTFLVESGLGPLEDWRLWVEGRVPESVDTVGKIAGRGGNSWAGTR